MINMKRNKEKMMKNKVKKAAISLIAIAMVFQLTCVCVLATDQSEEEWQPHPMSTYYGDVETSEFVYGAVITVKFSPPEVTVVGSNESTGFEEVGYALFVDDIQITPAVPGVENEDIVFEVDTTQKGLLIGNNVIMAKNVELEELTGEEEYVNVELYQRTIGATFSSITQAYTGNNITVEDVSLNLTEVMVGDEVSATADIVTSDEKIGDDKQYTAYGVLSGKHAPYYYLPDTDIDGRVSITKLGYSEKTQIESHAKYATAAEADLSTWAHVEGSEFGELEIEDAAGIFTEGSVVLSNDTLHYTIVDDETKVGKSASITIPVTSTNYDDFLVEVVVTVGDKDVPTVSADSIQKVYDTYPLGVGDIPGKESSVPGTWEIKEGEKTTNVSDSGVKVLVFVPEDEVNYKRVETTFRLIITKATPEGEPEFEKIDKENLTLGVVDIKTGTINAQGSVEWELEDATVIEPMKEYAWVFSADEPENYYELRGKSIILEEEFYTVVFDATEGIVLPTSDRTQASGKLSEIPVPTAGDDYEFLGWFTSQSQGDMITLETVFDTDTVVYAQWQKTGLSAFAIGAIIAGGIIAIAVVIMVIVVKSRKNL